MEHRIIDFHAHAFPDALASRAMKVLLAEAPEAQAWLSGTVGDLLGSMDRVGIEQSVICCIATKPEQFEPIFRWCIEIRSERLIPFPSVHPADPAYLDRIRRIAGEGFRGVKLHPFYQDFFADEERMLRFYEEASRHDLIVVMHTGYDIAFPRIRRADPEKLLRIKEAFPTLKFITTHLGAWRLWDEAREYLIGREIYMEISFGLDELPPGQAREMIMAHPDGYILFGTDSPWTDQAKTLSLLKNLSLPEGKLKQVLAGNAASLLGTA